MYTLRVPFRLAPGQSLGLSSARFEVAGMAVDLIAEDEYYVLTVTGLATEGAARDALSRVLVGFARLALDCGAVAVTSGPLAPPHYTTDGERPGWKRSLGRDIDVVVDGAFPVIFLTGKQLARVNAGAVNVLKTYETSSFVEAMRTGLGARNAAELFADEKLQTALELYRSTFFESSPRARFISHVMALESLAESQRRPAIVQRLLRQFGERLRAEQQRSAQGSEEALALASLQQELHFRTNDSIRSSLRRLIATTFAGASDLDELQRSLTVVYDRRSALLHDGKLSDSELQEALAKGQMLAKRVIDARIRA